MTITPERIDHLDFPTPALTPTLGLIQQVPVVWGRRCGKSPAGDQIAKEIIEAAFTEAIDHADAVIAAAASIPTNVIDDVKMAPADWDDWELVDLDAETFKVERMNQFPVQESQLTAEDLWAALGEPFRDFYGTGCVCSPSRGSFFARYSEGRFEPEWHYQIPAERIPYAQSLVGDPEGL